MQHKKSQHNETLKDLLKILTLLRKYLMNTLKNSSRYKLEGKTMLKCKKRQEFTPKLSIDMISPYLNLLFKAHTHQITLNKQGFGSYNLGACQRTGMSVKNKSKEGHL
jgi:hypothetical protein